MTLDYLETQLADIEEKQAFHDCRHGIHCVLCTSLTRQANAIRAMIYEQEHEQDDYSHNILEAYGN